MQTRFQGIECFNVATPVAYSDSFTNCHLCRSYSNLIANDERHINVRYCSNIVLLDIDKLTSRCTSACIHASKLPRRRVYLQARNREGEKSIEKVLIRFEFSCTRIGALHIRWFRAWVRCVVTAGEMIGMSYEHMHNYLRIFSLPLDWLSFSFSLVLFFYILYVVTHTLSPFEIN